MHRLGPELAGRSRRREHGTRLSQSATDEALVAAYARTGDREALALLVERHWEAAFRLADRFVRDAATAEDVAQDAFVALARHAARFQGERSFGPWFRTLVLNAARNAERSRRRRSRHEDRAARERTPRGSVEGPRAPARPRRRRRAARRASARLAGAARPPLRRGPHVRRGRLDPRLPADHGAVADPPRSRAAP